MTNVPDETIPPPVILDDSDQLIGFLRDRDVPCPLCGYNLRGLASGRCPECGSGLQLSVGLTEPFLRAWVAIVVSLCLGAGIGMFFLLVILKEGLFPIAVDMPAGMGVSIAYFLISIPATAIMLLMRRRFLKLGRGLQTCVSFIIAIATIVAFVFFFSSMH